MPKGEVRWADAVSGMHAIYLAGLIAGLREAAGIAAFRSILLSSPDESTGAHKAFEAIHARIVALETEEGE